MVRTDVLQANHCNFKVFTAWIFIRHQTRDVSLIETAWKLISYSKGQEFKIITASLWWEFLEVVETVWEHHYIFLYEVCPLIWAAELRKVLHTSLLHNMAKEIMFLFCVTTS